MCKEGEITEAIQLCKSHHTFSLIPPEHSKLSVQNLQREKNAWNFFNLSINVLMWWNYDRRSYVTFLMGSMIIKTPGRLWLYKEVFYRYYIYFDIKMASYTVYEQFRVNCLKSLIYIHDSYLKYIMYTSWRVHSSYKLTRFLTWCSIWSRGANL